MDWYLGFCILDHCGETHWMQYAQLGYKIINGKFKVGNGWKVIFNPSMPYTVLTHIGRCDRESRRNLRGRICH